LNNQKALYLQKRPLNKLVQPGNGTQPLADIFRLAKNWKQPFGAKPGRNRTAKFFGPTVKTYRWDSALESELVYVFVSHDYKGIRLHSDEVQEGKFWTQKQLQQHFGSGVFTPNLEYELQTFHQEIFG
jgi:isopentenyldiphosphate isomerase